MSSVEQRTGVGRWVFALIISGALLWLGEGYLVRERAEGGNLRAQYTLAKRYWAGWLVRRDRSESIKWLRCAAEGGLPEAEFALGLLCLEGRGVPRDDREAVSLLNRAAEHGSAAAQNQLGIMFTKGQGVQADLETALQWLSKAANGGSEAAKRNLALLQSARSKSNESNVGPDGKGLASAHVDKVDSTGVLVRFEPVPGGIGWAKVSAKSLPKGQLKGFSSGGLLDQVKDSVLAQMGSDFAQH